MDWTLEGVVVPVSDVDRAVTGRSLTLRGRPAGTGPTPRSITGGHPERTSSVSRASTCAL